MKTPDSDLENSHSEPKTRNRRKKWGILDSLSTAQQEQLVDWLELHPIKTVLEFVAAPPPEGFGIKTHITSMRRFQLRAQAHNQRDLAECHVELLEELGEGSVLVFYTIVISDVRPTSSETAGTLAAAVIYESRFSWWLRHWRYSVLLLTYK
jgi:hypothetical protein